MLSCMLVLTPLLSPQSGQEVRIGLDTFPILCPTPLASVAVEEEEEQAQAHNSA